MLRKGSICVDRNGRFLIEKLTEFTVTVREKGGVRTVNRYLLEEELTLKKVRIVNESNPNKKERSKK